VTPARARLLGAGVKTGAAAFAVTHLMFWVNNGVPGYEYSWRMLAFVLGLSLPGSAFSNPRQVDWYRRCVFAPTTALLALLALSVWVRLEWLGLAALMGILIAVPAAPLVWLIGALWIRGQPIQTAAC
jgi:hypothetical protein